MTSQNINLDEVFGGALRYIGMGILIVAVTPIVLIYILSVLFLDKVLGV